MHPNVAQFSQAGDQQGKCEMNVDAADLVITISFDWTFFEKEKVFTICGVPINGMRTGDLQNAQMTRNWLRTGGLEYSKMMRKVSQNNEKDIPK